MTHMYCAEFKGGIRWGEFSARSECTNPAKLFGADVSLGESVAEFPSGCPEGPFWSWSGLCPVLGLPGVAASHPPELVPQSSSQWNSVGPRDG